MVLTFLPEDRGGLSDLQDSMDHYYRVAGLLSSALDDGELSPQEVASLSTELDRLDYYTSRLERNHEQYKDVINKIVRLVNTLKGLAVEVQYIRDIERRVFPEGYESSKQRGYRYDESQFYTAVEMLAELTQANTDMPKGDILPLERLVTDLGAILGFLSHEVTFNVLYIKRPLLDEKLQEILDQLEVAISPIYQVVKQKYFRELITNARDGLNKVGSSKEMRSGQNIKIKGLFGYSKGVEELIALEQIGVKN